METGKKYDRKLKKELLYTGLLFLGCILFIFANIGLYPLLDIDETRYVNMSKYMYLTKEYLTPVLNFEPFLEKPPLYFWLNILVFKLFNPNNLFVERFATGLISSFGVFFTYLFVRIVSKSKRRALISSFALLSCSWFLIFSHIAILDLDFMVFSMCSIYCAVIPLFLKDRKKDKFFWFVAWIFMGLSILAKGFIGLAVPCMVVFFTYLILNKFKYLFKPANFIPGFIAFLIVTLPWHIAIYEKWGQQWINMYIIKHHFARLLNSEGLGRKQPFLFYVPILLVGLIPWVFNFILLIIKDIKKLIAKIKSTKTFKDFFATDTFDKKFVTFLYIYFLSVFLFFSSASTKLPSYILTVFPPLALLIGDFWYKSKDNKKELTISNYINSIFLTTVSFLGLVFALIYEFLLPDNLEGYIKNALSFAIPTLVIILIISIFMIITTKKGAVIKTFILHILFMLCATFCAFGFGLPYYTSFAQDELEEYADYIYKQPDFDEIVTFDFSVKYSILNPEKKIKYIPDKSEENTYLELVQYLKENRGDNVYIITKKNNKKLTKRRFRKIKEGKVYAIYKYR